MCRTHYSRVLRNGSAEGDRRTLEYRTSTGNYRQVKVPGHPLARADGMLYHHRFVLYAEIGPGEHACHWCSETVSWDIRRGAGALEVDHLNAQRDDNRPENLVASCHACNVTREIHPRLKRTACMKGHPYSPENTRIDKATGKRVCLTCYRAALDAKAERRRQAKASASSPTTMLNQLHEPKCEMRVEEK